MVRARERWDRAGGDAPYGDGPYPLTTEEWTAACDASREEGAARLIDGPDEPRATVRSAQGPRGRLTDLVPVLFIASLFSLALGRRSLGGALLACAIVAGVWAVRLWSGDERRGEGTLREDDPTFGP